MLLKQEDNSTMYGTMENISGMTQISGYRFVELHDYSQLAPAKDMLIVKREKAVKDKIWEVCQNITTKSCHLSRN